MHCRQGLLLASTICCPPHKNDHYYDAWCMYTLELVGYFGDMNIPTIMLGSAKAVPMKEINPTVKTVKDPFWGRDVDNSALSMDI